MLRDSKNSFYVGPCFESHKWSRTNQKIGQAAVSWSHSNRIWQMVMSEPSLWRLHPSSQYTGTAQNSSRNNTLCRCDRCHVVSFQNFGSDTFTNTTKTVWIYKKTRQMKNISLFYFSRDWWWSWITGRRRRIWNAMNRTEVRWIRRWSRMWRGLMWQTETP